jgi:hypothetical protein
MPVLKSLKFRGKLNQSLRRVDVAKARTTAAEHEFNRAEHHFKALPKISVADEERREALIVRDRKARDLQKLEPNHLRESVELSAAQRKLNSAKRFRQSPEVAKLRIGRALFDILLGSPKVDVMTKRMKRVFSVAKKGAKKEAPQRRMDSRSVFKKAPESKGPMRGRNPRK